MSDTQSPERSYKHKVSAEDFVEAFTTLEWTAEQTERFKTKGISIYSYDEINSSSDKIKSIFTSDTDESLLKEYKSTHHFVIVDNVEIERAITINGIKRTTIKRSKNWIFKECKINTINLGRFLYNEGTSQIEKIIEGISLYFYCSTLQNITINSFQLRTLQLINTKLESASISNGELGDLKLTNGTSVNANITLNSITSNSIKIDHSDTEKLNFQKKCIIQEIEISNNSNTSNIRVYNSVDVKKVTVKDSKLGFLEFKESNCTSLSFENVISSLHLRKSAVNKIVIQDSKLDVLETGFEDLKELIIHGGNINVFYFAKSTLKKDAIVSLASINIDNFIMDEFNVLGALYFKNINKTNESLPVVDNIADFNFNNKACETLSDLKLSLQINKPTFLISQSSLGKTEFTNCDLEGFNFEFNNSKITEVFISGGTLPKRVNEKVKNEKINAKVLEQQKSFFDQLKKVFEGQGDIVRGTKYHALASEKQMEIIEMEHGKKNSEWWVYWLNKKSNKHGESWWQAVKFIVYVSVPIYCFYCFSTPQFSFQGNWDWKLFGDFFGYYFSFLLPTHKVDFIPDVKQNVGTLFFDFFGRIAIGYGIYQLISAFRKHGKKA